jgi:predicted DNA binding CopG/RHH family protein
MENLGITMSAVTDADDIHTRLGDDSAWEEPQPAPRRKSERRQRGVMVSVRLSAAELEQVQAAAAEHGLTVATYMRTCALEGVRPPVVRTGFTTNLQNGTSPVGPTVTYDRTHYVQMPVAV